MCKRRNLCSLGCHQIKEIWEFRENQGILFSIRENQGKRKDILKIRENQGSFRLIIVSFERWLLSLYSVMHPVECENCQVFPLFIAFRSVLSF